jgi:hypothetical protein
MASRLASPSQEASLKEVLSSIARLAGWRGYAAAAGDSNSKGSKGMLAGAAQVRSQP